MVAHFTNPRTAASKADLGERGLSQHRGSQASQRWHLLALARQITTRKSLRICGLFSADNKVKLSLNDKGSVSVAGVYYCGSKICPVCSARVTASQISTLERASKKLLKGKQSAAFLTLTLPHRLGDDLGDLLDALQGAWNSSMSATGGKLWKSFGKVHYLRALDYTHGINGHHVHYHCVIYFDRLVTSDEIYWLDLDLRRRWSRSIRKSLGRDCSHAAVKLDLVREGRSGVGAIVRYVGKALTGVLLESLWSQGKLDTRIGGRTIWQILKNSSESHRDKRLWRECEAGFYRRKWLVCSRGLLKMGEPEPEPEPEVDQEDDLAPEGEPLTCELSGPLWRTIHRAGKISDFLCAFERQGFAWTFWSEICNLSLKRFSVKAQVWKNLIQFAPRTL